MSENIDQDTILRIMRNTLSPKQATDPFILAFIGNYVHTRDLKQASALSNLSAADGRYLFNIPEIYKCIQKITESAVIKFGYDAEQVVERVKELAFVDIAEIFDAQGRIIENIQEIPPEVRRAIKKFKYKSYFEDDANGVPQYRGRVYEIEMWDKPRSLELLGREKDTFKKTNVIQHDVSKNAAEFLLGSLARADERKREIQAPIDIMARDVTIIDDAGTETHITTFTKPPGVE